MTSRSPWNRSASPGDAEIDVRARVEGVMQSVNFADGRPLNTRIFSPTDGIIGKTEVG